MKKLKFMDYVYIFLSLEGVLSLVFIVLFIVAIVFVAQGAWWHVFSAIVSLLFSYLMYREARKNYERY